MFNIDVNKLVSSFEKSGVDQKLKAIDEKIQEKMKEVEATDFSSQSPEAAIAKMNGALGAIASVSEDMLNAATALKEPLIDFQTEFAKSLNSADGQKSMQELMDKAGITKFKATDISKKISDSLSTGVGKLGGVDLGKIIPKIKIKKETEYDLDGNPVGTTYTKIELAVPSNAPIEDATEEPPPEPFEVKTPAVILKNPFASNNGFMEALGRTPFNKFVSAVSTVVVQEPSTGENIIFEAQDDGSGAKFVPSGFPSNEDFEARFKQGREMAIGNMQKAMGSLKQSVPSLSNAFQNAAGLLGKASAPSSNILNSTSSIVAPRLNEAVKIVGSRSTGKDPVLGISLNKEELAKTDKEIKENLLSSDILDQMGQTSAQLDSELKPELDDLSKTLDSLFKDLGGPPTQGVNETPTGGN